MKIRTDFVSNSSSSSFICSLDDNQYGVLLKDFEVLDFDQYFEKFSKRDICKEFQWNRKKTEARFVDWPTYTKRFAESVEGILPIGSEQLFETWMKAVDKRDQMMSRLTYGTEAYNKLQEDEDKKCAALVNYIKEGLRQEYGDMLFCYSEIDNDSSSIAVEMFDCWSDESLAQERFTYISKMKPLKFERIFSNH